MDILVTLLDDRTQLPRYAHPTDSGMDLRSIEDATIEPGCRRTLRTGISITLPEGFEGQIRSRFGLAHKHGVVVLNSPGTIDNGCRGELHVILINHGHEPFEVCSGDRIAQLVVARLADRSNSTSTAFGRGTDGLGSTGVK